MAKTATIGVRVDEGLKEEAQEVLDGIGLPMSLAVEMFLRRVAEDGRLPFSVGGDDGAAERDARERDFWRAFLTWYFDVWPRFDSREAEERAKALGHGLRGAGEVARAYVEGAPGDPGDEGRLEALRDLGRTRALLGDAKELVYWALDMERTFVPRLAAACGPEADGWRLAHVEELTGARDVGDRVAGGVIGARYFDES